MENGRILLDLSETQVERSKLSLQRAAAKTRWERMKPEEQEKAIMRAWQRRKRVLAIRRQKKQAQGRFPSGTPNG
jgi:hypothetical protein